MAAAAAPRHRVASLEQMRVVAGQLGGRKLIAPEGDTTRPTTDKVRQAVFHSLGSMGLRDDALVVDLFAGSGAMGIEALSRGAARCIFVERDRAAVTALRANIAALGLGERATVVAGDATTWVRSMASVDLALVDPPYRFEGWADLLAAVDAEHVLCESNDEVPAPDGWASLRVRGYGRTTVTLLQRPGHPG